MTNTDGALSFDVVIKDSEFFKSITNMEQRIVGMTGTTARESKKTNDSFKQMLKLVTEKFSLEAFLDLEKSLIDIRTEFLKLETAFTKMLGSKEQANRLMTEMVQFAATTPFDLTEVTDGAKQLITYGSEVQNVKNELHMLGDVATSTGQPLSELANMYGSLRTKESVNSDDMQKFAAQNIPIYQELAKVLNINNDQVQSFIDTGKVGFAEVEQALKNMTSTGGIFSGAMDEQSKTLQVKLSNLEEKWSSMMNKIGESQEGMLSKVMDGAGFLMDHYEELGKVLLTLIATYGAYKTAVMVVNTINTAQKIYGDVVAWLQLAKTIRSAKDAQIAYNLATKANPIALAVAAIVGLIYVTYSLCSAQSGAELAQEQLNKELEEAETRKQNLESKTNSLIGIMKSETETVYAKIKAYKELQKMYPETLKSMSMEQFNAWGEVEGKKRLNADRDKQEFDRTEKQYEEALKKITELKGNMQSTMNSSGFTSDAIAVSLWLDGRALEKQERLAEDYKKQLEELKEAQWEANTPVEERISHYKTELDSLTNQRDELEKNRQKIEGVGTAWIGMQGIIDGMNLDNLNSRIELTRNKIKGLFGGAEINSDDGGNKAYWEKEQADAIAAKNSMTIGKEKSNEWKTQEAKRLNAAKKLKKWDSSPTSPNNIPSRNSNKRDAGPEGSLGYAENKVRIIDEALAKTRATETEQIEKLKKDKIEADAEVERIKNKIGKRSFDEELNYKREQYDLYQSWVINYTKEVADEQFKDLLKSGESYSAYLQKQITALEEKKSKNNNMLTPEEAEQLSTLNEKNRETFDKEIEYKKGQYELYWRWVHHIGQKEADEQFKPLINGGKNYKQFLEKEIGKLKSKPVLTKAEQTQLVILKTNLDGENGVDPLETFKKTIEDKKEKYKDLSKYISYLQQQMKKLPEDFSPDTEKKKKIIKEALASATKEEKQQLDELLKQVQDYNQRRQEIEKEYKSKRKKIENSGLSPKDKEKAVAELEKQQLKAIQAVNNEEIEEAKRKSALLIRIFSEGSEMSRKRLKQVLADTRQLIACLEGTEVKLPEGIKPEQVEALKNSKDAIIALFAQLMKQQDEFDKKSNYPFANFIKGFQQLKEAAKSKNDALKADDPTVKKDNEDKADAAQKKAIEYIGQGAVEAGNSVSFLSDKLKELAEATGDARLGEFAEQLGALGQTLSAVGQGAASGGWIGAAVAGAQSILTQTIAAFTTARLEEAELKRNQEDFVKAYQKLLLQVKEKDFETVFGVSALAKAAEAAEKARQAMALYGDELSKTSAPKRTKEFLSLGAAVAGLAGAFGLTKTASNEYKTLRAAFEKGYTDLQAMAIKTKDQAGVANFIGIKDKYTSLKDLAPQIWKDGEFDVEAAKAFLDTNTQINDAQRKQIQNVIDLKEAYKENMAIIKQEIGDTFGELGPGVLDAITKSIESGTNAWEDFGDTGATVLEKLGRRVAYELFFSDQFKKLQADLQEVYGSGQGPEETGEQAKNLVAGFYSGIGDEMKLAQQWMEQWQKEAEAQGMQLWGEGEEKSANGLAGAIKGVTEETAGIIAGQMNAIRINQADNTQVLRQQLLCLTEVAANSRYLERLVNIDNKISQQYDGLRAKGLI